METQHITAVLLGPTTFHSPKILRPACQILLKPVIVNPKKEY